MNKPIDKKRLIRSVANMMRVDPKRLSVCDRCGRVVLDGKPCCKKG